MQSPDTKLDWQEIFSYAELMFILFAALGFVAGVFYSFGGLLIDALVSLGWMAPETFGTTGIGWGTVLAFGALIGMPLLFGAVGWVIGALFDFILRQSNEKTVGREEIVQVNEEKGPTPLDTKPVSGFELMESFFSQVEPIDTRINEISIGLLKDSVHLTSETYSSDNQEKHCVVLYRKLELAVGHTDVYWELEFFCDFESEAFFIEANTGYETYLGRHSVRHCDEEDLFQPNEASLKVTACLDCLFGHIETDIEMAIEWHEKFLASSGSNL